MQSSTYPPDQPDRPNTSEQPHQSAANGPNNANNPNSPSQPFTSPGLFGRAGKKGMPGALVFALAVVTVHALGTAFGGWLILEENSNKQEHGQDLLMPWALAWFVALFCSGLAVLQAVCVVRARKRRPWVRVTLGVLLSFTAFATAVGLLGSLAAGAPGPGALVILGLDVAALCVVFGGTGRDWFSPHAAANATAPSAEPER